MNPLSPTTNSVFFQPKFFLSTCSLQKTIIFAALGIFSLLAVYVYRRDIRAKKIESNVDRQQKSGIAQNTSSAASTNVELADVQKSLDQYNSKKKGRPETVYEKILFSKSLSPIILDFSNYDIDITWKRVCKTFQKVIDDIYSANAKKFNELDHSNPDFRASIDMSKIYLNLFMRTNPQEMIKVHIFFRNYGNIRPSLFNKLGDCKNLNSLCLDNGYSKFNLDLATVSKFIPQKLGSLALKSVPINQKMISFESLTDLTLHEVTISESLQILPNVKSLKLCYIKIPVSPEFNFIFSEGLEKLTLSNCAIEESVFSTFPKTLKELELVRTRVVNEFQVEDTVDSLYQNRSFLDSSVFKHQYKSLTSLTLIGYNTGFIDFSLFEKLNFLKIDHLEFTKENILRGTTGGEDGED